jgi:hypothetical protein
VKKQRGVDRPSMTGEVLSELAPEATLEIDYPKGLSEGRYYDPLAPLAGPIENITPQPEEKRAKRSKMTALTSEQVEAAKIRATRYDMFIEKLVRNFGNEVDALAYAFGVENTVIEADIESYRAELGVGFSSNLSIADLMEKAFLGKLARVQLLRRHAYDSDPKVSLVALKLAMDLDGDKHDRGTTYESYLRLVLGRES